MSEQKVEEVYVAITKVNGGYVINSEDGTSVKYDLEAVIEFVKKILT